MKSLRVGLLVLLALLLPVRGAMANALLCPPVDVGSHGAAAAMHHDVASPVDAGAHDHAHHDHGAGSQHESKLKQDKCNLCSAFCSLTPLMSTVPGVVPRDLAYALPPDLSAPAASFLSDGQERPPRSI